MYSTEIPTILLSKLKLTPDNVDYSALYEYWYR